MITFRRGSSRYVLAIPALGLAFKIARIRWSDAAAVLKRGISRHRQYRLGMKFGEPFSRFLWRQFIEFKVEDAPSIKQTLCAGIVDNFRERRYYRRSGAVRSRLLQPTYISVFGLLNIQKYGMPMKPRSMLDPKFGELYNCYFAVVGPDLNDDGHHFANESNFHHTGSTVKFLDYASLATQRILTTYGSEIAQRFVPPDPSPYL